MLSGTIDDALNHVPNTSRALLREIKATAKANGGEIRGVFVTKQFEYNLKEITQRIDSSSLADTLGVGYIKAVKKCPALAQDDILSPVFAYAAANNPEEAISLLDGIKSRRYSPEKVSVKLFKFIDDNYLRGLWH